LTKLLELEKMRGLAILAVVIIHVTAQATIQFPVGSPLFLAYNTLNSAVQFAVPMFLFISSVVLSYKLREGMEPLLDFYRRRLRSALLPYILWSLGYSLLRCWQNGQLVQFFRLDQRLQELWTGTAYYHLYFLLIIIQLYLLLPLLVKLMGRFSLGQTILSALILQGAFYYVNKAIIYQFYPHPGNLLGSYLPVVLLGCWLGLNYPGLKERMEDRIKGLYLLNLILALLFVLVNIRVRSGVQGGLLVYYTIYHAFVVVTAFTAWRFFSRVSAGQFFLALGRHSFAIYLIHPLFLAFWHTLWQHDGLVDFHLTLLLGFIFVMAASYFFSYGLNKSKILRKVVLGR